jgi:hypothetical protein
MTPRRFARNALLIAVFTRYFCAGVAVGTLYALGCIALEYLTRPGVLS